MKRIQIISCVNSQTIAVDEQAAFGFEVKEVMKIHVPGQIQPFPSGETLF